ncbi:MAG: peptidylprolyl isomerase [Oscillospiraceae bacterium]|nr:peptidylprolyl isomerase [Oscillospiraceae bacterium]
MSGMFETKSDKASRKLARTQKEEKAKKKTRLITILVLSLLVLVAAAAIFVNSSFIRRTLPVVTIEGVGFTTTEFEYFFNSQYIEYMNMMSQFQGMGGNLPTAGRPLSTQVYDNETGETWADFFTEVALERMSVLASLYNAAQSDGFALSEEHYEEIEQDLLMIGFQAMIESFPNTDTFLQQLFGNSINENQYRSIMEFVTTATAYSEHIRESFNYSPQELADFYAENSDDLDVFNFRTFSINHEYIDSTEFDSDEDYEAAVADALAQAQQKAAKLVSEGFENAEAFVAAAQEEADSTMSWVAAVQNRMGENLDITFEDWLRDESRVYGDVTAVDNNTGSTLMYFISRDDNTYKTAAMRQILISRESIDPAEFAMGADDPGYIAATELAEANARERAELVNSLFTAAGETEDALISLMAEHSDDTTEGGLYEDIAKFSYNSPHLTIMKVVPEIEDWLFEEGRVQGDSKLIYTSDFGYHLIYFMGFGDPFFELISADRMRTAAHTEWMENLPQGEPVKHAAFILVHV